MAKVSALVLRAPGTNCDLETVFALESVGASAARLHINQLLAAPRQLHDYQLLVLPGGFSYGDDVAAGKVLAYRLHHQMHDELSRFRDQGKLILGICNGFQALLKAGLLIPPDHGDRIPATLTYNISGSFVDRWVTLRARQPNHCPFLSGYGQLYVPIAHGEGRFICRDEAAWQRIERSGQCVLQYVPGRDGSEGYNPNGSQGDVAGLCDQTGRILGLMPHPERHLLPVQHPQWTRLGLKRYGDGLRLFQNAVHFLQ